MKCLVVSCFLLFIFSSCYTYRIYPREDRSFTPPAVAKKARLINPELKKEAEIIRRSGIFDFSDSSHDNSVAVYLKPMQKRFVCGIGAIPYLYTVGQLPALLPDNYDFRFDEINGTDTIRYHYNLQVATHYWFWDMFVFNKRFEEKAARTLGARHYKAAKTKEQDLSTLRSL
jgi:hypothetical protein